MRGLSTVAAFVVFLTAFAVVMFSVFYFYNALREATQKGVETIYSAVTRDASVGISFNGKICNLAGGPYLYYVVTNGTGHVVYNGSGPPPCPPAKWGLYTYRAVRRDGGLDVALVAVGNLSLSFSADRLNAVVNDYNRTVVFKIRAQLVNPNGAYALLTNITATPAADGFTCTPSELRVDKPLLIPPGGSLAVDIGAVACNATDAYLYVQGAPPVSLTISGAAYYNGVVVASASQPVASIAGASSKPGNFTAYGGRCRVGYFSGDAPRYYVLLSGASPVARGLVNAIEGSYAVVPCPASSGFFRYRVVTASGAVVEVPVSVGRVLAWAESNMTVAYVNGTGQSVFFDLYLRFTNPNAGYTALNFTYTLMYNTQLLNCSLYAGQESGTLTLQPGETRAIYVATYRCVVLNKFNETNIAVNITATYTGGGYTATLYRGVVGKPSFAGAPSWVVLKILWGNGTAVANPGYSALQLAYRKSLATLRWAPMARPPPACPPTLVYVNRSLFPLLSASWALAGIYNVTTLIMKVFPGWPEDYVPATLAPTQSPQSLSLSRASFLGAGLYSVYLGNLLQFSDAAPGPGPAVTLPAYLRWWTNTSAVYTVVANATVPTVCTYPLLSFTAVPMINLLRQTYACGTSQLYDDYSNYATNIYCNTTDFSRSVYNRTYIRDAVIRLANAPRYRGTTATAPSLLLDITRDGGIAVFYIDVARWLGRVSASASFSVWIYPEKRPDRDHSYWISFFIDIDGDGSPDREVIYYARGGGYVAVGGYLGFTTQTEVRGTFGVKADRWRQFQLSSIYPSGYLVGVALAVQGKSDADAYWDDVRICPVSHFTNAPYISVTFDGWTSTGVYIDTQTSPSTPPSLVTEVDASDATGTPSADYGYASAVYNVTMWAQYMNRPWPVPGYGTSISVWGRYVRDSADVQNNVAYLSIGVDTNGDGQVDKEYFIYRYDTAGGSGVIISMYFDDPNTGNPMVVCTVSSAGVCTPADPRFVVVNAGSMASGGNYQWSYTLYEQGAVLAVALVAVDATRYRDGTADDFWVYWDDLTIEYSACPPPTGWSAAGSYVWQSYNYLLVTGSATAYMPLITAPTRALTYVANFTGVGTYAVFDSSLNVIFGVSASGSSFTALCGGGSTPLGSLPAARYVELRPLNGFGDVIIRDQYGAVLARYGCRYTITPQYVGFRGGLLRVYQIEAWG
jgi:hypothetical protein